MKSFMDGNDSLLACAVACYGRFGTGLLLGLAFGCFIAALVISVRMIAS